jgi:hypothetical protein
MDPSCLDRLKQIIISSVDVHENKFSLSYPRTRCPEFAIVPSIGKVPTILFAIQVVEALPHTLKEAVALILPKVRTRVQDHIAAFRVANFILYFAAIPAPASIVPSKG